MGHRHKAVPDMAERFWSRVDTSGECWEWTGAVTGPGYGVIRAPRNGPLVTTHRYSFMLAYGPVSNDTFICHTCDNRRCVRPDHLFAGDNALNMQDMAAKGRGFRQQRTHCAQGHEMTEDNTYHYGNQRKCRACSLARSADYKRRTR